MVSFDYFKGEFYASLYAIAPDYLKITVTHMDLPNEPNAEGFTTKLKSDNTSRFYSIKSIYDIFCKNYESSEDIDNFAMTIIEACIRNKIHKAEDIIPDKDFLLKNVYPHLINSDKNLVLSEKNKFIKNNFLDLSVIYTVYNEKYNIITPITEKILKKLNITETEVKEAAMNNLYNLKFTCKTFKANIIEKTFHLPLKEKITELPISKQIDIFKSKNDDGPMLFFAEGFKNEDNINIILNTDFLKEISKDLDSDIIIFLLDCNIVMFSYNEALNYPDFLDKNNLQDMINLANSENPASTLTEKIYKYSKEKNTVDFYEF